MAGVIWSRSHMPDSLDKVEHSSAVLLSTRRVSMTPSTSHEKMHLSNRPILLTIDKSDPCYGSSFPMETMDESDDSSCQTIWSDVLMSSVGTFNTGAVETDSQLNSAAQRSDAIEPVLLVFQHELKTERHKIDNAKDSSHRLRGQSQEEQYAKMEDLTIPEYVECTAPVGAHIHINCKSLESTSSLLQEMGVIHCFQETKLAHQESVAEPVFDRLVFEHLRPYFSRSAMSQEALQQWDKQQGLPPSHARTTLNSGRTRRMVLEFLSS